MTPSNMVVVLCDASQMKNIRIVCRCGHHWDERIPRELHDSDLIVQFSCTKCGRYHLLKNHVAKSFTQEEYHDRFGTKETYHLGGSRADIEYDA